ncbi:regulator of cell morphogenesis and NO signaling [Tenacibaculum sp. MAR_2009_124]|uniref:iron-sulfur cluster repair di-iron protein n=1 Tax=Tenacibaculum sp. MAR_2009_124 TaxID=1250059 RepID=UPI00089B337A|nr:iron-sulfur cluster repair di-iron protein [Tenacibaculum sp. MAR_2009_124]SEB71131.1 regulator of cell morphogenesis and NO signaling [Tenacibaculum sp. MAR_2009_124]
MNINSQTLISDIVAENYKTATVFKKYGVDFCCNGNRTLSELSSDSKVDVNSLINEIDNTLNETSNEGSFIDWEIDFLSDYIYQNHHLYIEKQIPEIKEYLQKVCGVHGSKNPELLEVSKLFNESAGDLVIHMKKEELILFPYIKKVAKAKREGCKLEATSFSSIENPIEMMHVDHDNEGERFREIARLTNNYTPPKNACNSYRIAYKLLKDFEEDLHKHIHLENNILFRRAISLEAELNRKQ